VVRVPRRSHGGDSREKNLKRWLRRWKIDLIERTNPTWRDLYDEIAG
jgi:putative endonuclease